MTVLPSQARYMTADELAARHMAVEDLCGTGAFRLAPHGAIFFDTIPPQHVEEHVIEAAALLILDDVRGERARTPEIATQRRTTPGMFAVSVTTDLRLTARRKRLLGRFRAARRQYQKEMGIK